MVKVLISRPSYSNELSVYVRSRMLGSDELIKYINDVFQLSKLFNDANVYNLDQFKVLVPTVYYFEVRCSNILTADIHPKVFTRKELKPILEGARLTGLVLSEEKMNLLKTGSNHSIEEVDVDLTLSDIDDRKYPSLSSFSRLVLRLFHEGKD